MKSLFEELFSGAYNDVFGGQAYGAVMSGPAHAIGCIGLILVMAYAYFCADKYREIAGPLMAGVFLRAVFCLYNTYFSTFNVDDFESWATDMSGEPFADLIVQVGNSNTYTVFCAIIYKLGGRNPLLIQDINIFMWVSYVVCLPRISLLLGRPGTARPISWLCALLPASVFFSTVILRESFCTLGVVYGSYYLLRAHQAARISDYLIAALWFLLAALIHYGCVVLLLALVASAFIRGRSNTSQSRGFLFNAGVVLIAFGLLIALFRLGLFERLAPTFAAKSLSVEAVGGVTDQNYEKGRTDYMAGLQTDSVAGITWTAPIRFLLFLMTPFPWMIRKAIDLIAFVDVLAFIIGIYWMIRARKAIRYNPGMASVMLACFMGLFVFAMGTANYGTAVRHRAKFFPVVMTLAGVAWDMNRTDSRRRQLAPQMIGRQPRVRPIPRWMPNQQLRKK